MSEFAQYLNERPELLLHPRELMGAVKDAMGGHKAKSRAIQAALDVGILDSLRVSCPLDPAERRRLIQTIRRDYAMVEKAAEFAVDFWENNVSAQLFQRADQAAPWDTVLEAEPEPEQVLPTSETAYTQPVDEAPVLTMVRQDTSKNGISIQWKRHPKVEGYRVIRTDSFGHTVVVKEGIFPLPRYCDTDVTEGALYSYSIVAVLKRDEKQQCTKRSNRLMIAAPSNRRAFQIREMRSQEGTIQISWPYKMAVRQYVVRRKQLSDAGWTICAQLPGTQFSYTDKNLSSGASYLYQVEGECRDGSVITSEELEVTV